MWRSPGEKPARERKIEWRQQFLLSSSQRGRVSNQRGPLLFTQNIFRNGSGTDKFFHSDHTSRLAREAPRTYINSVIDTEQKLAAFLPKLHAASWVAVDTEADSLHAYPEKVCLFQISTISGDILIDPVAGTNIDPVLDALSGHDLIMHGADYDLRLVRKHHEF